MRALLAVGILYGVVIGCSDFIPPRPTYEVPVSIDNRTRFELQLVISDEARVMGDSIGSATPAQVPAFDSAHPVLTVPRGRDWAMFVVMLGNGEALRTVHSSMLGGCETFRLPIAIEISLGAVSISPPSNNC